jgi:hypothetical protein
MSNVNWLEAWYTLLGIDVKKFQIYECVRGKTLQKTVVKIKIDAHEAFAAHVVYLSTVY